MRYYRVKDPNAKRIGKADVVDGMVYMSEAEASHWLRMGVIEEIAQ
ncbi:MAG: hypothetical protein ACK4MV_16520 [Beijerinckiaceae bacterium]